MEVLELNLDEKPTLESLKKQYKNMVLKNHPDKGGVTKKFIQIKECYDGLKKYIEEQNKPKPFRLLINFTATSYYSDSAATNTSYSYWSHT